MVLKPSSCVLAVLIVTSSIVVLTFTEVQLPPKKSLLDILLNNTIVSKLKIG